MPSPVSRTLCSLVGCAGLALAPSAPAAPAQTSDPDQDRRDWREIVGGRRFADQSRHHRRRRRQCPWRRQRPRNRSCYLQQPLVRLKSVHAFQRAVGQDTVVAVIGGYRSQVALALEPWSARLDMPFVAPGAASDLISKPVHDDYDHFEYAFAAFAVDHHRAR